MKLTDDNKVKLRTAGGVEAVVKAINTHVGNVDVCEQGCAMLMNMTIDNSIAS